MTTIVVDAPARADGLQLIGEMVGSGYRTPPALVRRGDGQTLQVTPLLYAVLDAADGRRTCAEIAAIVRDGMRREITADMVATLVEEHLRPLGLLKLADGSEPALKRANPLLALKLKYAATDPATTRRLTDPFRILFRPGVVAVVLVAFLAITWWVFFEQGLAPAAYDAFHRPELLLLVFVVTVLSGGFHEFGHAAAARYGGADPGVIGAGIYLVWPAFYTDVTDSYRLGRRGRVRDRPRRPLLQCDRRGAHLRLVVRHPLGRGAAPGRDPDASDGAAAHADAALRRLPPAGRPDRRPRPLPPDPSDTARAAAAPVVGRPQPRPEALGPRRDHRMGPDHGADDGVHAAGHGDVAAPGARDGLGLAAGAHRGRRGRLALGGPARGRRQRPPGAGGRPPRARRSPDPRQAQPALVAWPDELEPGIDPPARRGRRAGRGPRDRPGLRLGPPTRHLPSDRPGEEGSAHRRAPRRAGRAKPRGRHRTGGRHGRHGRRGRHGGPPASRLRRPHARDLPGRPCAPDQVAPRPGAGPRPCGRHGQGAGSGRRGRPLGVPVQPAIAARRGRQPGRGRQHRRWHHDVRRRLRSRLGDRQRGAQRQRGRRLRLVLELRHGRRRLPGRAHHEQRPGGRAPEPGGGGQLRVLPLHHRCDRQPARALRVAGPGAGAAAGTRPGLEPAARLRQHDHVVLAVGDLGPSRRVQGRHRRDPGRRATGAAGRDTDTDTHAVGDGVAVEQCRTVGQRRAGPIRRSVRRLERRACVTRHVGHRPAGPDQLDSA